MAIYILRTLGLSRQDAARLPRWERNVLVQVGRIASGATGDTTASSVMGHGAGEFTADELVAMGAY